MSDFMEPEVLYGDWYMVDGPMGTEWVPADLIGNWDKRVEAMETGTFARPVPEYLRDFTENTECWTVERVTGYGARLSAPGYLDCTDWTVFETEKAAVEYLEETYEIDA